MEEGPSLQQYSKQLNVYDPTEAHRGRLFVNYSDQFEISYKTGLGPVVIQALHYQEGIGDVPHNLVDKLYEMTVATESEATRATAAEGVLTSAISTERTRAQAEEKKSSDGLASEVSARSSAVAAVSASLAIETAARIASNYNLSLDVANEATARIASDGAHTYTITVVSVDLATEAKRADDEEKRIVGLITSEYASRASADATITTSLATEKSRAETAEAGLQTALDAEVTARGLALDAAQLGIATTLGVEFERAVAAEAALAGRIDAVLSNIDAAALDSFTEVVIALQGSGAGGLAGAINSEETRALAAEASLQGQISALLAAVLALQAPY